MLNLARRSCNSTWSWHTCSERGLLRCENLPLTTTRDTHVRLHRLKGSEGELTVISDRLREALSEVRGDPYIVHQYTESGFRSAWRRLQADEGSWNITLSVP